MRDYVGELQKNQSSVNQGGNQGDNQGLVQKGSDLLRGLGLGILPTIGAGVYEGGRAISSAFGNQNAYVDQQGNTVQDPFATEQQLSQYSNPQSAATQTGKDIAGLASYGVPEIKLFGEGGNLLTKILGLGGNRAIQGGIQGVLNAVSQGENPVVGAATGAVTAPAIGAAGNTLTDILPRYIGLRNFGAAGLKLPEVVKAEQAAATGGYDSLQAARQDILDKVKPFELNPTETGGQTDRQAVLDKITNLADSTQWKGTNGLADLVKRNNKTMPQDVGAAPDIKSLIQDSSNLFDAYSQIKNYADSLGAYDNNKDNKLRSFLRSAGGIVREHLITTSEDPNATRKAMNMYADQTAMNMGKGVGGNKITNMLANASTRGGEAGLAALASVIPQVAGLSPYLAADTALTNRFTGPATARGLVNTGQAFGNSGADELLRRLGISGAQAGVNNVSQ